MVKIKSFIANKKKSKLIENIFFLAVLQMINYLLPVIMLPFLVRVIGLPNVGILAITLAFATYFQMIGEYGFNLTATKAISKHKGDSEYISEVYSAVFIIKIVLLALGFIGFMLIMKYLNSYNIDSSIYISTYIVIIGQVMFPSWFFQGKQDMKFITIINALTRILGAILIVFFVKNGDDTYFVPLINGVFAIISCVIAYFVIFWKYRVYINRFNSDFVIELLRDGWYVFISRIFSVLYKNSNVVILGFFATPTIVGGYSILERVIRSIQMIQNVIGDALFPYINSSKQDIAMLLKKYLKYILFLYASLCGLIVLFSPLASRLLLSTHDQIFIFQLSLYSSVLLFGGLSYYFGVLGLISLSKSKQFSTAIAVTGIFNLLACSILSFYFSGWGAVISSVLSEILLFIFIIFYFNKVIGELKNEPYS